MEEKKSSSCIACGPHLRGPVKAGDYAMFGPVFIVEESTEGQTGAATQVSEKKTV